MSARAEPLQTPPLRIRVIDGRSFRDIETGARYRLYGIDVCEPDQMAHLGRQPWPCGATATAWLVNATLGKWIACNTLVTLDDIHYARCAAPGHPDLGASMLREGVAIVAERLDAQPLIASYSVIESTARKAYRGIWASRFERPWVFRKPRSESEPVAAESMAPAAADNGLEFNSAKRRASP